MTLCMCPAEKHSRSRKVFVNTVFVKSKFVKNYSKFVKKVLKAEGKIGI